MRKKEICPQHYNLEKVLYCLDCNKAVCPICFYEDPIHTGHTKELAKLVEHQLPELNETEHRKIYFTCT